MFSDFNKPNLIKSNMPFGFDESPLDIQELLSFRDKFNGDLNASLMDIKLGWKNHYSWRPDFLRSTKRLFSTRKTYISDPINFASLLQIGLDLPTVQKVVDYVLDLSSKKAIFDEHLHYDAAQEYLRELDQLKSVAIKKSETMNDNKEFITSLDNIINQFTDNLNKVYPSKPLVNKNLVQVIE